LLASDALVITASLGGSGDEATRKDWISAVKACRTMARLASLTKGFVQAAKLKLSKLQEEQEDLAEALTRWEKEAERKVKKVGRPPKTFEGPSEVWTNVEITNEICMAKSENYPWWPSKKCIPRDPVVAERLAKVDRCIVSLFGEMGSLRVVKNDGIKPFTGEAIQDEVLAGSKKDMRNQLEEFIAMARRLQRGLEKKSASSRKR
jgi:PWWP domain